MLVPDETGSDEFVFVVKKCYYLCRFVMNSADALRIRWQLKFHAKCNRGFVDRVC